MITAELEAAIRPMCRCGLPASMLAIRHLTDHCTGPGTTPDGGTIWILCMGCMRELTAATAELIEEKMGLAEVFACGTCAKPIRSLHDILKLEAL